MGKLITKIEIKTLIEGMDECIQIYKPQITTFQTVKYHNYCRIREKLKDALTEMILNSTDIAILE